jgi:hypothetical protein
MKHKYFTFCLINAALILAIASYSCSEKDEDIAAPSIEIIHPGENDTIKLTGSFVTLEAKAQDHVGIRDMEMTVKDISGALLFTYDKDDIENETYTCHEPFYPTNITKVTQMNMTVTFANEYKNWTSKTVTFYVKP